MLYISDTQRKGGVILNSKLRELRGGKKLSDIAPEINISLQYLSKIEKGERNPSLKVAYKLSKHYNIPIEELFPDLINN